MEMEYKYSPIDAIGNCVDNIYRTDSSGTRKVTAKLSGNSLFITYQTIMNIVRDEGMHIQTRQESEEASKLIKERLSLMKKDYKEMSGKSLRAKKVGESDAFETISVSPYNPRRVVKYSLTCEFEVTL